MRPALALAAALALVAAAPAATAQKPVLRLSSTSPVTVVGTGFQPREKVVVSVTMRGGASAKAVTARNGRFVVRFARTARCGLVLARAVGSKGSRAAARSLGGACIEPGPDGPPL
ncbi:MAG TPA: hypothetical protein VK874_02515 [Gaiellaceae bacterium]|nr:hypothetical protein [Gaiellaceae bacterium]